ncbi:MAG: hypothetical protein QXL88_02210 [Candidatus Pacearchaeota archaeon]
MIAKKEVQMGNSTAGFILGLIGGILGIIWGIVIAVLAKAIGVLSSVMPVANLFRGSGLAMSIIGIWYIISGALVILFSTWMKNPEKCTTGGILTLIFSIIGSGGLLGLIGGIFGIVQGKKK